MGDEAANSRSPPNRYQADASESPRQAQSEGRAPTDITFVDSSSSRDAIPGVDNQNQWRSTSRLSYAAIAPPARADTFDSLAQDNAAWKKQNCLSLDGGGIRGYWSLLVLQKLMQFVGEEEQNAASDDEQKDQEIPSSFGPLHYPQHVSQRSPSDLSTHHTTNQKIAPTAQRFLPCHYFDYVCGSSTGALIAIMLSRFRMTAEDCLEEYEKLAGRIFGNPRGPTVLGLPIISSRAKYSTTAVEEVYRDLTIRRAARGKNPPALLRLEKGVCKLIVTTLAKIERPQEHAPGVVALEEISPIRSYVLPNPKNRQHTDLSTEGSNRDWHMDEVARAATAAEFFFDEFKCRLANGHMILRDGGMGKFNNPTKLIFDDIVKIHGNRNIGIIVSIGTARKDPVPTQTLFSRLRKLFDINANPEEVHREMLRLSDEALYGEFTYFRFNNHGSLGNPLDDWRPRKARGQKKSGEKTLDDIHRAFEKWFSKRQNFAYLQRCARDLVRRRRERTINTDLWDRFATASSYQCKTGNCDEPPFIYKSKFREHWIREHCKQSSDSQEDQFVAACNAPGCRVQWEYRQRDGVNGV